MKKTLMFASLASLSLALVACPNTMPSTIASVTTPAGTYTTAAGGQVVVPVVVTRATGNTNAALTFTCSLSGTGLATAITGTAVAAGTSGGNGSCTYTVPAATTPGTYTSTATSTVDTSKKATANVSVTTAVTNTTTRINVGGPAVGSGATAWLADAGAAANWACFTDNADATTNGTGLIDPVNASDPRYTVSVPAGTQYADAAVYGDNRYCQSGGVGAQGSVLQYTSTSLATGTYTVRLHWAENYQTAAGNRVFSDITVNGNKVNTANIDVFSAAGGKDKAYVQDYTGVALAAAGPITVRITASAGDPMLSGIEFIKQ